MLYVLVIVLGTVLGLATGGSLLNLIEFRLEKIWLMLAAFFILLAARMMGIKYQGISDFSFAVNALVSVLLIIGFWFNRHYGGIWLIGAGCLLNSLVVALNNGKMPVSIDAAAKSGISLESFKLDIRHFAFSPGQNIKLSFLADIIYLPGILGYGTGVVSAGDIVIAAGVFLLAFQTTGSKNRYFSGNGEVKS